MRGSPRRQGKRPCRNGKRRLKWHPEVAGIRVRRRRRERTSASGWQVQAHLNKGPLTAGQKDAVKLILSAKDAKQLDAVDAGKPFAQLQAAGMQTATMDEIMRQRDPELKQAVEASLKGDIEKAFEKLGGNVAEVKPDNIAGAVAARWLRLDEEARANTGVMAPSHELRQAINGHIRERLAREGRIHGPAMASERLVSRGYTNAEKALAGNYAVGDVVAFHRPYKRIGVEKGDERRVMGVDHKARAVMLDDGKGGRVAWKPEEIGGRRGGSEVYRAEEIELRAGDRIRWTCNDAGLGLVNSRTAEVLRVANGRVTFRLEDGKMLEFGAGDPQLRHLDHAWASTVHAFQGRTVENVIAAMEARHPHLTTQKSFYVEISRARDRAELVTDDAAELRAQLQAVTGEGLGKDRAGAAKGEWTLDCDVAAMPADVRRGAERRTRRGARKARRRGPHLPGIARPERLRLSATPPHRGAFEPGGRNSYEFRASFRRNTPNTIQLAALALQEDLVKGRLHHRDRGRQLFQVDEPQAGIVRWRQEDRRRPARAVGAVAPRDAAQVHGVEQERADVDILAVGGGRDLPGDHRLGRPGWPPDHGRLAGLDQEGELARA